MHTQTRGKRAALYGMLIGLAFIFSYIETLIPISLGVPGVKLGLANLVGIISLEVFGAPVAVSVTLIRVLLNAFTFGNLSACIYSMAGAFLSLFVMVIVKKADLFGTVGISIMGGVFHNVGQLLMAAVILETSGLLYYLPVLLAAGTAAGCVIGIIGSRITTILRKAYGKEGL